MPAKKKGVRVPKKKLAIFDVDGTIFRSSLLIELVKGLIAENVFKPEVADLYARAYEKWQNREGEYQAYLDILVAAFRKNLAGVHYRDLRRVAYKVVAAHRGRTYRYTRDLVRDLKARGYYILAVSHSPKIVLEAFAKSLGFSKVYGIMYETDKPGLEGRFTGNILFPEIVMQKDKLVRRTLEGTSAGGGSGSGFTLRGSIGVGDTESDVPFLELVERAICFNPNAKLYREARRRGWEVVVERKDVIYKVQ